jgi:BlaI family transcriptional regulator, penicillinase repressor
VSRKQRAEEQLPPMELAIMHVLWDCGPCTVQQVQEQLGGKHAYTTVQTILNTMEAKRRTSRELIGRAYVYSAALARETALKTAVRDLVDRTFKGSVEGLLMNLVQTEQVDAALLRRLEKMVKNKEAKR